ncbi:hypothetical protein KP509_07G012300 [Ceratopteris richardii]|nr:hypothetical protein KP509_07G012300 [Ceratopteris richardii]
MSTKLESVPLHWVCESCEMQEKASAKKKFISSMRPSADPKQTKFGADLSSCSAVNETKDKVLIGVQARLYNVSKALEKPTILSKGTSRVNTCPSKSRSGAVKSAVLSPRLESSCLYKPVIASKGEGIVNTSESNVIKANKALADKPLLDSKHVFSRSLSSNSRTDELTFLLPSKPKTLSRSKSAIVQRTTNWHDGLKNKSFGRHMNLIGGTKEQDDSHPTPAKHNNPLESPSHMVERFKTFVKPKLHIQAGEGKNKQYNTGEGKNKQYDTGEGKNKQYDWSTKASESPKHFGKTSDSEQNAYAHYSKDIHHCYKCNEFGHVATVCNSPVSSSPKLCRMEEKSLVRFDNLIPAKDTASDTCMAEKTSNSPKRTFPSKWNGSESVCKAPMKDAHNLGKQAPITLDITTGNNFQPSPGNVNDLRSFTVNFETNSDRCKEVDKEIGIQAKEGLFALKTLEMNTDASPKAYDSRTKAVTEHVQMHSLKSQTRGPCTSRGDTASQCVQNIDAIKGKHTCWLNNSVEIVSGEPDSAAAGMLSGTRREDLPEPCIEVLWSGCFKVLRAHPFLYNGMQAHASSKADPRVSEAVRNLPFELNLEELKRGVETDTWPRSLQDRSPTVNNIGVYFFPVDMECHDTWYKPLLDHLTANDLALRTKIDLFQLLIFPSQLLPDADQCWEDRQYLWGVIRSGTLR